MVCCSLQKQIHSPLKSHMLICLTAIYLEVKRQLALICLPFSQAKAHFWT